MIIRQLALVSEVPEIPLAEVLRVASALQKQVARDFAPLWHIPATVDGFASLEQVPLGYWQIIIIRDVPNVAGYHTDNNGQPYSLVEAGRSWSLTASHEVLEMLANPFGNWLVAGRSPAQNQGRVEFLVEVCDPPADEAFAYTVNDVLVSDFYTPRYFDPLAHEGVQYSFNSAITAPRQVLPGGYLSWHEPVSNHWFQLNYSGVQPEISDLGMLARNGLNARAMVDALTPQTRRLARLPANTPKLMSAISAASSAEEASVSRAESLRQQIDELPES